MCVFDPLYGWRKYWNIYIYIYIFPLLVLMMLFAISTEVWFSVYIYQACRWTMPVCLFLCRIFVLGPYALKSPISVGPWYVVASLIVSCLFPLCGVRQLCIADNKYLLMFFYQISVVQLELIFDSCLLDYGSWISFSYPFLFLFSILVCDLCWLYIGVFPSLFYITFWLFFIVPSIWLSE